MSPSFAGRFIGCLLCVPLALSARGSAQVAPRDAPVEDEKPPQGAFARLRHDAPVFALDSSPDGKLLASGSYDRTSWPAPPPNPTTPSIRIWDTATGKLVCAFPAHGGRCHAVAFAPDGKLLASVGDDGKIRFWDPAGKKEMNPYREALPGHTSVAFSPDGKLLAAAAKNQVRIWDRASEKEIRTIDHSGVSRVAFAPDSNVLASVGGLDSTVALWSVSVAGAGRKLAGESGNYISIAFAPGGQLLAAAGNDPSIRLWDLEGKNHRAIQRHFIHLAFAPDGRTLAAAGPGPNISLWELASGNERWHTSRGVHVQKLAFAPDGRTLASADEDTVTLWDIYRLRSADRPRAPLSARTFAELWDRLAAADAAAAFGAVQILSSAGEPAVRFLSEKLHAVAVSKDSPGPQAVAQWIRDLDSSQFAVRQKAMAALEKLGRVVAPQLRQARTAAPTLEARRRLDLLLDRIAADQGARPTTAVLQILRSAEVLETIGSPDARRLLETLAQKARSVHVAIDARTAVERLSKLSSR
jgi:hypothetical protein